MSIYLMSQAYRIEGLTTAQKAVLVVLCDHANDDGQSCYPSIPRIARHSSLSERTVYRVLTDLEEAGYIKREAVRGRPSQFTIDLSRSDPCQIVTPDTMAEAPDMVAEAPDTVSPEPSLNTSNRQSKKRAHGCPDDFWPEPSPESKTAKAMSAWPQERIEREVERFVAHHQARGNKYTDWQRAWTTWALSDFQQRNGNVRTFGNSNQRTAELAQAKMQSFG